MRKCQIAPSAHARDFNPGRDVSHVKRNSGSGKANEWTDWMDKSLEEDADDCEEARAKSLIFIHPELINQLDKYKSGSDVSLSK